MNTLMQRFGRAARGAGTEGIAILFAENKYFDEAKERAAKAAEARRKVHQEKASRIEKRKRDSINNTTHQKRRHVNTESSSPAANACAMLSNVPAQSEVAQLSIFEDLRIRYTTESTAGALGSDSVKTLKPENTLQIGPEMDNLINAATRPFQCFRTPVTAYYENDRRRTRK